MQIACFSKSKNVAGIPIIGVPEAQYGTWIEEQDGVLKNQLINSRFEAKGGEHFLFFDKNGALEKVVLGMEHEEDFWAFGNLSVVLPQGQYRIISALKPQFLSLAYLAWGLGSYQFTRYKSSYPTGAELLVTDDIDFSQIESMVETIFWVRNLINTPTQDMNPKQLALEAEELAKHFDAEIKQILGDELQVEYPCVYAVGKGSSQEPRLIDLRWGSHENPKVTLVGKGVCFDSGGYNLKPSDAILTMKKDMAGAAHVLGLARLIMTAQLPIRLRVLIPAVENLISGHAYLPDAVLKSRKGTTIEITNTDAEGRLILADALFEASSENPDLLIDFATLTGAATVAVGTDIAAFFTNQKSLAHSLMEQSEKVKDPLWQLPLYVPYRAWLKSKIADMCNAVLSPKGAAGSITAALFLESFVHPQTPWVHFDIFAGNKSAKPGRPEGGEAMALRTVFSYLKEKYPPA